MSYSGTKLRTLVVGDTIALIGAFGLAVQLHSVHPDMPVKSAPRPLPVKTVAFETTSGTSVAVMPGDILPSTFFISSGSSTESTR